MNGYARLGVRRLLKWVRLKVEQMILMVFVMHVADVVLAHRTATIAPVPLGSAARA